MAKTRTSWQRGVSGNAKGRPHVVFELRDAAREHGPHCVAILAQLAGIDGPGAANEAVQLGAARELLDRGFGRPVQAIAGDAAGPPVGITYTFHWADAVTEQQPEPEPDDAAVEAGAGAGFVVTFAETC